MKPAFLKRSLSLFLANLLLWQFLTYPMAQAQSSSYESYSSYDESAAVCSSDNEQVCRAAEESNSSQAPVAPKAKKEEPAEYTDYNSEEGTCTPNTDQTCKGGNVITQSTAPSLEELNQNLMNSFIQEMQSYEKLIYGTEEERNAITPDFIKKQTQPRYYGRISYQERERKEAEYQ